MEKAFAKLHGTFEDLNGGSMAESLVDLTGGASEKYNLRAPEIAEMIET
jgi:calpain, invertebrate